MKRGDVIFWPYFKYADGGQPTDKLLVVIGTGKDGGILMFRVTKQERPDRPDPHGCHSNESVFRFRDGNRGGFDVPSWIQYEQPIIKAANEIQGNVRFCLNQDDIQAVINCYKKSPEICTWLTEYCS